MKNFSIFLLIFFTLTIVNSQKSEASGLSGKNLENYKNGEEILVNEKYQFRVKCHLRAQIIDDHKIVENKFTLKVHGKIVNFKGIPWKHPCNGTTEAIEIFATEKIIIDRNFNAHGNHITFIVAAPLWHVIGRRRVINLNGSNGLKEKKLWKTVKHESGRDGREGVPGGAGGEFQGIAGFVINRKNLFVYCNGGRGANGGNGERGEDGWNGTEFNLNVGGIFANGSVPGFEVNITSVKKVDNGNDNDTNISYYMNEDVLGRRAKSGGNGGNGAPGGEGGYAGYQILLNFNNSTCSGNDVRKFVDQSNGIKGENGINGFGGHSGRNGRPGKDVSLSLLVKNKDEIQILNHTVHKHDNHKRGRSGIDGVHFTRNLRPKMKSPVQNFMTTERLFKDYLKSHVNDTIVSGDSWYRTMQDVIINCSFHPRSDE